MLYKLDTRLNLSTHSNALLAFETHRSPENELKLPQSSPAFDKESDKESMIHMYSTKPDEGSFLRFLASKGMKSLFHTCKDNVQASKLITSGRKTTFPTPIKVNISKVKIPILNIKIPGAPEIENTQSTFNAEWIDYHDPNTVERVILYIHGGAYFFASRRTHRAITWRLAKNAKARVLCKLN